MKVCFFGNYLREYPRNEIIIEGLRSSGVEVVECNTRKRGLTKFIDLYKKHKALKGNYDILLVAFSGHAIVWFARILTKKKIVFDAFVSLDLTNIEDRETHSRYGLRARYYAFFDYISCKLSDTVLLDTQAQIQYFLGKYKLDKNKFYRIFVGANENYFYPLKIKKEGSKIIVHWHGYIVPFNGIEIIIQAANILRPYKDIEFRIITRFNSAFEKIKVLADSLELKNIIFFPEMNRKDLAREIQKSDICLGIFGDNKKAQVVIPNKIFEAVACAKPVITAKHSSILELFQDGEDMVLCKPLDSDSLAKKILILRDSEIRKRIGKNSFFKFENMLTTKILGSEVKKIIQNTYHGK